MSGRPLKENLDFSSWDVSILDNDEKIDMLIDAQGIGAFTIYFYLCQKAYGSKGYYLDWSFSRCATIARRLGKGASAEYVKNVVEMCFQCGLFEKRLFELHGILTSRGIQKRYLPVAKARTTQQIVFDYWLLDENESAGLVSCTEKSNYEQPKSNYEQPKSNYQPQKESKVEESKVNESIAEDAAVAAFRKYEQLIGLITPSVQDGIDFFISQGVEVQLIIRLIEYACEQGKRTWAYIKASIKGNMDAGVKTLAAYNRAQAQRAETAKRVKESEKKKGKGIANYVDTNKPDYSNFAEEILTEMLGEEN